MSAGRKSVIYLGRRGSWAKERKQGAVGKYKLEEADSAIKVGSLLARILVENPHYPMLLQLGDSIYIGGRRFDALVGGSE